VQEHADAAGHTSATRADRYQVG